MKKLILVFLMVCGMAIGVNAKCINADGKWENTRAAKELGFKEETEKIKKAVEEILRIEGKTMEQAKDYKYVKFLRGLEMFQKSDRCLFGDRNILEEYAGKNNDEYYFYDAKTPAQLRVSGFMRLLGDDFSGKSGELRIEWRKARQESHSKGVWMEMSGESVFK